MAKTKTKQNNNKSNIFVRSLNKFTSLHKPAQVLIIAIVFGVVGGGVYAVSNSKAMLPNDGTASLTCTISATPTPKKGSTTRYKFIVKNIGSKSTTPIANWTLKGASETLLQKNIGNRTWATVDLKFGAIKPGESKTLYKDISIPNKDQYGNNFTNIRSYVFSDSKTYKANNCNKIIFVN